MQVNEGGLGDLIHHALEKVGVTPQLVEEWVGAPCGCEERRQKLNFLSLWSIRVIQGKIDGSVKILRGVIGYAK